MRALLPLALLLTTACYTPRAIASDRAQPDHYGEAYNAPLQASVFYHETDGFATFRVNRQANVAMFSMRPGGGMELIYPRSAYTRGMQFSSGSHSVRTTGSMFRLAGNWSTVYGSGPMYILLVASEGPLDVSAFRTSGIGSWFNRTTLTHSPHYAMEALVDEVVRTPVPGRYTTAMQVVWPDGVWPDHRREQYVAVQCANGTVVTIPRRYHRMHLPVCPGDVQEEPADSLDPKELREQGVKRPQVPAGWMRTERDVEMEAELWRIRELNRRSAERQARSADGVLPGREAGGQESLRRPAEPNRPTAESRPARRPETNRRPARPAAESRPATRPKPAPRPVRPSPPRAPEPRPAPRKPKPDDS